jgi:hypothetical protein
LKDAKSHASTIRKQGATHVRPEISERPQVPERQRASLPVSPGPSCRPAGLLADFLDDTIDRVRDDDWDDLEDEVEELREAVAAINAKIDRLLSQSSLDVRDTTTTKPVAKTPA